MNVNSSKASIVYDGECQFCIRQIERIQAMDAHGLFEYVPRQSANLADRFPALEKMNFEEGMRLVDPDGGIFVGADAVYQIARRLPATRLVSWLYCVPILKQIAQLAYRLIASNRKRLGQACHGGLCKIATQEDELKR